MKNDIRKEFSDGMEALKMEIVRLRRKVKGCGKEPRSQSKRTPSWRVELKG